MLLGILKAEPSDAPAPARTGIVTSRRIGSAVVRSLVRRRLREIIRHARPELRDGYWLVVVAKPPASRLSFSALQAEWAQLARRGGILRATP